MDALFWLRAAVSAAMDLGLAVSTGLILARIWLSDPRSGGPDSAGQPQPSTLTLFAGLIFAAAVAQLFLLSAAFSGERTFSRVVAATPGIISTHAGSNASAMILAALLLLGFLLVPTRQALRIPGAAGLLLFCLCIHSGAGHAGADGNFTFNELLQATHLLAISLWSGGILVSGLLVVPRLASSLEHAPGVSSSIETSPFTPRSVQRYLASLSSVSTWAVAFVMLSGLAKSYRALGGDLHQLLGALWGYLLMVKCAAVMVALTLGGLNRLWIAKSQPWGPDAVTRSTRTLRVEAWSMLAILLLSAVLANTSLPGE